MAIARRKGRCQCSKKWARTKRLLLSNLKELYQEFKNTFPQFKVVRFSKFCTLRPKWCVTVHVSGTYAVCACTIHQNVILLADATKTGLSYKDMIKMIVCDSENIMCMLHRCPSCPGSNNLQSFLDSHFSDLDYEVTFQQWQSTDRMDLVQQTLEVDDFIQWTANSIDKLIAYAYVAKCQGRHLKGRKDTLEKYTVLVLADFSENYTFIVQNEVQSYHWNRRYCTLHPVVIYFKRENELLHQSFCFLSDDLEHDTNSVYEIQRDICGFIKKEMPWVAKVEYFSDGCASQYKTINTCLIYATMRTILSYKQVGVFLQLTRGNMYAME